MTSKPPLPPVPGIAERIEALHAEINALIDARVEEIKKDCPGVPGLVIRRTFVRGNCPCTAYGQLEKAS